jgi:CzcA family heavy metal efflux pump
MTPNGFLGALIVGSIRHRFVVLCLAGVLAVFGALSLSNANYDVFPDFAPPQAVIQTEAPGLSADQVETLITRPIENAIIGVPTITAVRSNSIQGLSAITVIFVSAADVFRARQQLTEAMAGLAQHLPEGIDEPRLAPLTSSTGTVMIIGLTSQVVSPADLRVVADWTVRPRLLALPGVAKISIYGGATKEYQIAVDPARLAGFDLSLEDVVAAARRALGVRGAGFIDNANQRIVIEASDDGTVATRLANTVLASGSGRRLTLGEVATIAAAPEPAIGAAAIDGREGLQLIISAQYGANTVKVAAAVDETVKTLARELARDGITVRGDLFRPAGFIQTALGNLENALLLGGVLVIGIVILFLWDLRMAIIALTAIPLSLLAGVIAMTELGYSLNTMTLGGLGIAVGLLVDDAVIVVENVYRRLREDKLSEAPWPVADVIAGATYEVRSAVVFATLAIALIFVPVLTIEDVAGRLFGPLGLAYVLATLASLLVALTVTPALCSCLIDLARLPSREPPVARWLKARYRRLLVRMDRHLLFAVAVVVGVAVAVFAFIPFIGTSFIPELKEGHYVIQMSLAPGTSLEESLRIGNEVSRTLLQVPHVRLVAQRAGRAEQGDDVFGTHYSEFEVDLGQTDAEEQEETETKIRAALQKIPGATFAVMTFLSDRLDEVVSGFTAPVVIRAYGNNLDELDEAANRIAAAVSSVDQAVDVQQQNPSGIPKLIVRLHQEALLRWGFNALDVLDAIRTAYQGVPVGQIYEGDRVFNAAVLLAPNLRKRPEAVSGLLLKSDEGVFVPLRELAQIDMTSSRYGVLHEGGRRVQIITADTTDSDVGAFSLRVKKAIAALSLPTGITIEYAGAAEAQSQSMRTLLLHSAIAAVGMLLLLSLSVPRIRNLGLIFLNLPFAMVGGILALLASGGVASLGALVGFVTLFGITLRNGIMMISHYSYLATAEDMPWTLDTAIEGAADRLSPILMTSLATALGLLPLALGSGEPGRELEGPMAIVILGGLVSSAILNLLILPGLALRFGRFTTKTS